MEQLQSQIWGRASYNIWENAQIFPHIWGGHVICNLATAPLWISLSMRKIWFSFYQCVLRQLLCNFLLPDEVRQRPLDFILNVDRCYILPTYLHTARNYIRMALSKIIHCQKWLNIREVHYFWQCIIFSFHAGKNLILSLWDQILSPLLGDIVDYGIGLLYGPPGYIDRYESPIYLMPLSIISPSQGLRIWPLIPHYGYKYVWPKCSQCSN